MIPVDSAHPPGIVGISAGELARYTEFTAMFAGLYVPVGTQVIIAAGYDTAYNSNDIIRGTLEKFPEAQWIQIWDDDHSCAPDTLLRLLDRQVDVIVPLYTQRQPPGFPCIFKEENADGSFTIFRWEDLEGFSGILPVVSAGKGGVLIRRPVVEKLAGLDERDKPEWFERQGKTGEDHLFYKKAREAGFGVYVDLDVWLDHLTSVKFRPHRDSQGHWCAQVDLKRGVTVELWSETYNHGGTGTGRIAPKAVQGDP